MVKLVRDDSSQESNMRKYIKSTYNSYEEALAQAEVDLVAGKRIVHIENDVGEILWLPEVN